MNRMITMFFALRALLAPLSPTIEVRNLAKSEPAIVNVADACIKVMLTLNRPFQLSHEQSRMENRTPLQTK